MSQVKLAVIIRQSRSKGGDLLWWWRIDYAKRDAHYTVASGSESGRPLDKCSAEIGDVLGSKLHAIRERGLVAGYAVQQRPDVTVQVHRYSPEAS